MGTRFSSPSERHEFEIAWAACYDKTTSITSPLEIKSCCVVW